MPDRVCTILSTGSLMFGESPVPANRNAGIPGIIEEVPFIKIILNTDENTRGQILSYSRQSLAAVFTSANAVRAVTAALDDIPDWDIYCVGNETRKQVACFFGSTRILGAAGNAEGLAERIVPQEGEKKIVFFCGDQRRNVLPDKLNEKGIEWQELVVYQTRHTPVRLTKNYDAILFFSPTAVASFFSINMV
ncbi:MAG TPA: uroporphyrinogen-III synthase, partial [Puia sp.]